jgi:hypothetical protein
VHRPTDDAGAAGIGPRAIQLLDRGCLCDRDVVEDAEGTEDGRRQQDALEVNALSNERDEECDLLVALERRESPRRGEDRGEDRRRDQGADGAERRGQGDAAAPSVSSSVAIVTSVPPPTARRMGLTPCSSIGMTILATTAMVSASATRERRPRRPPMMTTAAAKANATVANIGMRQGSLMIAGPPPAGPVNRVTTTSSPTS